MEKENEVIVEDENYSEADYEEDYDSYMADILYEEKKLGLI